MEVVRSSEVRYSISPVCLGRLSSSVLPDVASVNAQGSSLFRQVLRI